MNTKIQRLKSFIVNLLTPPAIALVLTLITPNLVATDEGTGTLSPPTDFCQAKTYSTDITCSGNTFVARTIENVNDYNSRSGLVNGEYKDIAIAFAMTGETVKVHSPCKIKVRAGLTHTAQNICLDSKGKLEIYKNSIFNSQKIHILPEGGMDVEHSSVFSGTELEIFTPHEIFLNRGVRLNFTGNARIISTATDQRIRFGAGAQVTASNLNIIGHNVIKFLDTKITATETPVQTVD